MHPFVAYVLPLIAMAWANSAAQPHSGHAMKDGEVTCADDGTSQEAVCLLQTKVKVARNIKASSSTNVCVTIGTAGVGAGHACVFPFKYEKETYSACTMVDSDKPWCYTQVDGWGAGVAGAYGTCGPSCAPDLTSSSNGIVDELYSYGPPGAGFYQDFAHFGGCFPGMRVYTENVYPLGVTVVDFASMATSYSHALSSTLVLHWNSGDSWYFPCPGKSGWPYGAMSDMNVLSGMPHLHATSLYLERIKDNTWSALSSTQRATVMTGGHFAKSVYDTKVFPVPTGWVVVASHDISGHQGVLKDSDKVLLAQNQSSLDCVLAFSGTDSALEAITSITSSSKTFCGFSSVHKGFTDEIWTITASKEYQDDVKLKLGKCKRVTVVGHSLGGSISEVFAACINSGRTDLPEYQQMAWTKGTAELMSSV